MRSFEVNTHHAYLNTDIILKSIGGACEVLDQTTGATYNVDSILNIKLCAGKHMLCCAETDQSEEILIEDAIKLGGSKFKPNASFVSEVTPWIAVTMKDRIYFYNRDTKAEFVEYNLSPESVKYIGGKADEYFLFGSKNDYSVFNAIDRHVTYNCKGVIYKNDHLVISEEQDILTVYDYISDVFILQYEGQYSISGSCLFYVYDNDIYKIELNNNEISKLGSKLGSTIYQFGEGYVLVYHAHYGTKIHYKLIDLNKDKGITMYMNYFITSFCGMKLSIADEINDQVDAICKKDFEKFINDNDSVLKEYFIMSSLRLDTYEVSGFDVVDSEVVMNVMLVSKCMLNKNLVRSSKYFRFKISNCNFINNRMVIEIDGFKSEKEQKIIPFSIDSNKGELVCYSDSERVYISFKDGKLYETNTETNSYGVILENIFDCKKYLNAYFTSDGCSVVAVNSDKTANILGFENLSDDRFDTTNSTVSFISDYGVNGYKYEFSILTTNNRKPVWRDPITLNIVSDEDRAKCIYKSPDGKYTAKSGMQTVWHNNISDLDITHKEYCELQNLFDWGYGATEEEKNQKYTLREKFAQENTDYIDLSGCHSENFTHLFVKQLYYVYYQKKGSSENYRILIGENVWFLNYISFSYDSCYLALGAKLNGGAGVFILYDLVNNVTLHNIKTHDEKRLLAVWIAMFSKNGSVAYYDSSPNTYILDRNDGYKSAKKIENRSLLCFSPSGHYIALSKQGYIAYNHGKNNNWGHQPSGNVYIYSIDDTNAELRHYNDLGESINGVSKRAGNVASAAFSTDEKRFLVVGDDGVIVVRNLNLTNSTHVENDIIDVMPF